MVLSHELRLTFNPATWGTMVLIGVTMVLQCYTSLRLISARQPLAQTAMALTSNGGYGVRGVKVMVLKSNGQWC
jgi:hypothetical protein